MHAKASVNAPDLVHMVQSSLSDCTDQYNSVGDLIEDAINAIFASVYSNAIKFLEATIGDIDTCGSLLKSRIVNKSDLHVHFELTIEVLTLNDSLKITVSAALNFLKA
ncbi:PMEI domain-containing protein [Abeliophyllum distichum]|uniref:PMEI domain-containing protein n=1 Tax=Abeliophyllum distichum TaxID=126358 RepID=A0ABD1NS33_9LAMI